MRILCVGGGPAGLYFALLVKRANPRFEVTVVERNRPYDTFGWGVVFSDQTLGNLAAADPESHAAIEGAFFHWDDIDVHFKGALITSGGHGFCGIGRKKLLNILQRRCEGLGVELVFDTEISPPHGSPKEGSLPLGGKAQSAKGAHNRPPHGSPKEGSLPLGGKAQSAKGAHPSDPATFGECDLIVASDGINSALRSRYAHVFRPTIERRKCRYIWLGTHRRFEAFTFAFERTQWGWFQAHAYRFDEETSTFIVETPEMVWRAAGLDRMSTQEGIVFCEQLFARYLDGAPLMTNAAHVRGSAWINFLRVANESWLDLEGPAPVVLVGDAAHTAHFSVGSGTKLALEDAIALARAVTAGASLPQALRDYEAERMLEVLRIQNAARNSTDWFENVDRYSAFEAEQFAYSLLTRSQRISHENLRLRDSAFVARTESWLAARTHLPATPVPPMFTPFTLRGVTLPNRVVVSPMAQYSCTNGTPDDYYLVHLGSRAQGGAGLVFTEMTCVSADARISPGCAGMYAPEHQVAWTRIVDYVHARTNAKIALQLGHAGPKGSTQLGWENPDEPLGIGNGVSNWPLIAPSVIAYGPRNQMPREMTREDMTRVREDFVRAAAAGACCGFDWLELHCAHGYLLSAFISPLTNHRRDEYGGGVEARCRFPLEVFAAMRAAWPQEKPMSVRISAHDWARGGNTDEDALVIARLFKAEGADLMDVSSGQTTRAAQPIYGRMYQTPFADRIRNEVGIATMAVGAIFDADHVNSIIMAGRADLCALGRPHLADPYWTLHAAAQLGYHAMPWPKQYLSGKAQLERNIGRAAALAEEAPGANG